MFPIHNIKLNCSCIWNSFSNLLHITKWDLTSISPSPSLRIQIMSKRSWSQYVILTSSASFTKREATITWAEVFCFGSSFMYELNHFLWLVDVRNSTAGRQTRPAPKIRTAASVFISFPFSMPVSSNLPTLSEMVLSLLSTWPLLGLASDVKESIILSKIALSSAPICWEQQKSVNQRETESISCCIWIHIKTIHKITYSHINLIWDPIYIRLCIQEIRLRNYDAYDYVT